VQQEEEQQEEVQQEEVHQKEEQQEEVQQEEEQQEDLAAKTRCSKTRSISSSLESICTLGLPTSYRDRAPCAVHTWHSHAGVPSVLNFRYLPAGHESGQLPAHTVHCAWPCVEYCPSLHRVHVSDLPARLAALL
jgi:hypothetical protein